MKKNGNFDKFGKRDEKLGNLPKIQRFKFERASFRNSGGREVDRLLVIGRRDALVKGRPCYRESPYRESRVYKNIEDENITTDNPGGNEQMPINDENLIKDFENKELNDINYEDFEKRKTCEDFENVGQLNEEAFLKMLIIKNVIMRILMKTKLIEIILKNY